jgi:alpha-D-xyloside xylohydrolase
MQQTLFEQLCQTSMASKWGRSGFYNFARSAVDRSRALTNVWNGDSHANFTGLRYSIASGIRAGLLGFSTWSSDTGGYIRSASPVADQPTPELWARWMHFSAFSPVYEIMIGTNHTPWYTPYPKRLVSVLKSTANEHTALVPYIKSFTYQASITGVPVIRAAFLEAPNDPKVLNMADAYFFGDSFFVAPVTQPGGSRTVYFPNDTVSVYTDRAYLEYYNKTVVHGGGTTVTVHVDWEYSPVYVREGALVVRGDIYQGNNKWTMNWKPSLTIEAFPSYGFGTYVFPYFNGEQVVNITLRSDTESQTATVQWDGDLGINDTRVVFFGKNGVKNMTAPGARTGGFVQASSFKSLFG